MKRLFLSLFSVCFLLCIVGCSKTPSSGASSMPSQAAEPKDYATILHNARSDEDNTYQMIFSHTPNDNGLFTAIDGYSSEYEAEALDTEIRNFYLPMLNLEEADYTAMAVSVSPIMNRCYGVAIVRPAEGRTQAVQDALNGYIDSQKQTFDQYLIDQYEIAQAAIVTTAPTGEVILVCCENNGEVLTKILAGLSS